MSALRGAVKALRAIRVPRAGVLVVAAVIVAAPAGFVIADPASCSSGKYRCNAENQVKHRHTKTYSVFNAIGSVDSTLQQRASDARAQWNTKLGELTSISMPNAATEAGAAIKLRRYDFPDSNASVMWEAGYHPAPTTEVAFDANRTQSWSGAEKQGRTCRVLGNLLGLENAGPGRDDCMEDPATRENVKDQSVGLVDDYYGPNLSLSGSFKSSAESLESTRTYELNATATGHAMAKVEIFIDGASQPASVSTPTTPCADGDRCVRSATLRKAGSEIGDGQHTLRVVATNEFGQTATENVDVFVEHPATGILPHYSFEDEQLWDRASTHVNVVSGNLVFEQSDFEIAGTTLNLRIGRYYNSLSERSGDLGKGWSFDTGSGIELKELANGDVRFFGPSGYAARFKKQGTAYETPTGVEGTLSTRSEGGWDLDLNESEERYVFDSQGRFDEHVNEKSDQRIDFVYGAAGGKLSEIVDTQERHVTFDYWTQADVTAGTSGAFAGRLKQIKDPTQRNWRYLYDSQGRLIEAELRANPADSSPFLQTLYGYDSQGRLVSITDPRGTGVTQINYVDQSGRVASVTRPVTPSAPGIPAETDAGTSGYVRSFTYSAPDPVPSECFEKPASPTDEEKDYELTVVTAPRGNESPAVANDYETTYCHDGKNRVRRVIDANGNQQSTGWTTQSNVKSFATGSGATSDLKYQDSANPSRLTRVASAGGAASTLTYSGSSTTFNPSTTTDPQGNTTSFGYENPNNTGNLTSITNSALGSLVELEYHKADAADLDWKGLLKSSTLRNDPDSGGDQKTTYEYDGAGNLIEEIPPGSNLQGSTRYEYDALSRVAAVTDGSANGGVRRAISYDLLDRPVAVRYPPDVTNKPDEFKTCLTYDENGNLVERIDDCDSMGASTKKDRYTYNYRNLRQLDKLRGGREIRYGFDPHGNMAALIYQSPNAGQVLFDHDEVDLLTQVTEPPAASAPSGLPLSRVTTYDYSEDYLPKQITFPNGVVQAFEYRMVDDLQDKDNDGKTMEPTHDVLAIKAWARGTAQTAAPNLMHLLYDYDNGPPYDSTSDVGQTGMRQRVRDQITGLTTEYDYDALNRVSLVRENGAAETYRYTYDKASNLRQVKEPSGTRSYEYNVVNEIRCSYTGAQQADCPAPADAKDYTYDQNGNLDLVEEGPDYRYDKRNRTAELKPFGQIEIPFDYADYSQSERLSRGTTQFTDTLLGTQIEDSGSAIFYSRTDAGQPFGIRRSTNKADDSYLLADSLGSTSVLTTGSGQLATRYRYEPSGEAVSGAQSPYNPFRFAGQYLDTATGHYKMGLRYYDPATQRWTQKDPLNLFQDPRQANRYVYAGGDPVNAVDPSGQIAPAVIGYFALAGATTGAGYAVISDQDSAAEILKYSACGGGLAGGAAIIGASGHLVGGALPQAGGSVGLASGGLLCFAGGGSFGDFSTPGGDPLADPTA